MKIEEIKIIRAENIRECLSFPFDDFGWGDSGMTLMAAPDLISEIEGTLERIKGKEDQMGITSTYQDLLEDLRAVPAGVWVGFPG